MNKMTISRTRYSSPNALALNFSNCTPVVRAPKPRRERSEFEYQGQDYGRSPNTSPARATPRFAPIGTKRCDLPKTTSGAMPSTTNSKTGCATLAEVLHASDVFLSSSGSPLWMYSPQKPMKPKERIMYEGRNVLDLAANLRDPKWKLTPAQLPVPSSSPTGTISSNTSSSISTNSTSSTTRHNGLTSFEHTTTKCDDCDFEYPAK